MFLSKYVKNFVGTLMEIALTLKIAFCKVAIFTMFILLIQKLGRSRQILISSAISFYKGMKVFHLLG